MSRNYERKKLEKRYERLLAKKRKEAEEEKRRQEELKLSRQLKFADCIENIDDTEARFIRYFKVIYQGTMIKKLRFVNR